MQLRMPRTRRVWLMLGSVWCAACGLATSDARQSGAAPVVATSSALAMGQSLSVQEFTDPQGTGNAAAQATQRLITQASQYRRLFGHAAPSDIDFRSEAVLFYATGSEPTGGYVASFGAVQSSGGWLRVSTELETPGAGCIEPDHVTQPNVLARVTLPRRVFAVRFEHATNVHDCTSQQSCGGIAARPCPGGGTCSDDPSDNCDPQQGGADCSGICSCVEKVFCPQGDSFDSSPSVCACVPQTTQDPCASARCVTGTHCEAADGGAQCLPDPQNVFCGGIAAIACPGGGKCGDDPNDDCDPQQGGADCGGICSCVENVLCVRGDHFDNSPQVCACVSDQQTDPCATTSCAPDTRCEVYDGGAVCVSTGTLACGSMQCPDGTTCCNASCGMCAPPGFACTQIACLAE
jgi:hypothetical protein